MRRKSVIILMFSDMTEMIKLLDRVASPKYQRLKKRKKAAGPNKHIFVVFTTISVCDL